MESMANFTSTRPVEPIKTCDSSRSGTWDELTRPFGCVDQAPCAGRVSALCLASEVLFIDSAVDDIATILGGLRPGVEAFLLHGQRPVSRQIADVLAERKNLDAIHVIAHGAPGRVSFAAGEWSAETLAEPTADFAAIGKALRRGGELCLWSCYTGRGKAGKSLICRLAAVTGASIGAAAGRVGAKARGGAWELNDMTAVPPPLTSPAIGEYAGLLDGVRRIVSGEVPRDPAEIVRYVVVNSRDKRVVATFSLPGHANIPNFAITVTVPSATDAYEAGRLNEHGQFIAANFTISETFPFTVNTGRALHDA